MTSTLLRLYSHFTLKDEAPSGDILLFANIFNTGIGNLVWLYPVMKSLEPLGLTVVCEHDEMSRLLSYNLPMTDVVKFRNIPNKRYGASVNNFLTQTNKNARKIISLRINSRIGHIWEDRKKYSWLFNYGVKTNNSIQEFESNRRLLKPFGVKDLGFQNIELPPTSKKFNKFDVLIQPHTSNESKRDFLHYFDIIKKLDCRVGLIGSKKEFDYCESLCFKTKATNLCGMSLIDTAHLMKRSIVVGNDGGLVKLAYSIGSPVIQIIQDGSEYTDRSWIKGSTMISPTQDAVLERINNLLTI